MSERVDCALEALRWGFDRAFTVPIEVGDPDAEDLLVLRLGYARYAVRLAELRGLERAGRPVPLPGAPSGLAGLVGCRGRLVPLYHLAALVQAPAVAPGAWMLLAGEGEPVGLAIGDVERVVRVRRADIAAARDELAAGGAVPEAIALEDGMVGLIRMAAVMAALRAGGAEEGEPRG